MMTTRYCPTCAAEVQDAGGFCMLGHRLAPEPPPPARAGELDGLLEAGTWFEEGPILSAPPVPPPPAESSTPPPPPPATRAPSVWDELEDEALAPNDPIASFSPPPRMDWGPSRSIGARLEAFFGRPHKASRASV